MVSGMYNALWLDAWSCGFGSNGVFIKIASIDVEWATTDGLMNL